MTDEEVEVVARGDDLGDRMKRYEAVEDRRFDGHLPIYARIDGRAFSRFTRGMERPFDRDMSGAMVATAKALVEKTHARIGYTQSDEISLVWLQEDEESQVFFDGRVQKLCSVLAGLATAAFTQAVIGSDRLRPYADRLPHFDCRVMQLPSISEAANMFLWRELDATKNAVQMAAQALYSPKQLHGKNQKDQRAMIAAAGVDFESYPAFFKRGTFVRRETFDRPFTVDELARIPEAHRPPSDTLVTRSEVRELDMPPLLSVANREAVIFARAAIVALDAFRKERA